MNNDVLSVVIPAYNEEKNLPDVVEEIRKELNAQAIPYELVVVNDNSQDGTARVIADLMADDPHIRTVNRQPPGGFGRAVRAGLQAATGDIVVVCMADSSDAPEDITRYYKTIQSGYDCVFGSRFVKGSSISNYPFVKLIVNRLVNRMIQVMFWCPFNDLTNAFKAYRTYVIRAGGPYQASHFNLTIELSLSALIRRYKIAQIPIQWRGRTWGCSNLSLWKMGRRYLATLTKIFSERILIQDDILAEIKRERAGGFAKARSSRGCTSADSSEIVSRAA